MPRWGKGSIKKLENKRNFAMPEVEGKNPFEAKGEQKALK